MWKTGLVISRIVASADVDEQGEAARAMRARANAGDGDSAWLLDQWDEGNVVLASIVVTVSARDDGGREVLAERRVHGVWLEREDPPGVETQIAEVAPSELQALAGELRSRGVPAEAESLEASFVHVELSDRLRAALARA